MWSTKRSATRPPVCSKSVAVVGRGVAPFDAFLFVVFALMAVGAAFLLVPYLHSLEK